MKKIAVVTVNYNTQEDTIKFLESLKKVNKQDLKLEIIVVDNASKKPLELPEEFKDIILIRLDENLGFTGGYNRGIDKAIKLGNEYILIINNDTLVDPDLIKNLIEPLEKNERIGLTVPKIYFAKGHEFHKDRYKKDELGKVLWYAGGNIDWANSTTKHIGVDEVDIGQHNNQGETGFATGCCMMIKTETLKEVGLFDNNYFLYFEDADLNERIKKAGYKIYYVPSAILYHANAASSGSGSLLHDYYLSRNKMLFGLKYAPLRTKIALIKESLKLIFKGRPYQRKGIIDFYLRRLNKGSFNEN